MFSTLIFRLVSGDLFGFFQHLFFTLSVFVLIFFMTRIKQFKKLPFEIKYFSLMIPFFISISVGAYLSREIKGVGLIFLFGLLGMLLETALSWLWSLYFNKRIYFYTSDTLAHAYTSWLNFIPWACGGAMFFGVYQLSWPMVSDAMVCFVAISTVLGLLPLYIFGKTSQEIHKNFSVRKVVLLYTPFLVSLAIAFVLSDWSVILLALNFGIFGVVFEYLFGKVMKVFFGKQLWVYQYLPMDGGLTSIINFVPWMGVGFWFVAIGILFRTYIYK